MKPPKRNIIIIIWAILTIIGGLYYLLVALPVYELSKNIPAGGIYLKSNKITVTNVSPSSPAEAIGIKSGDQFTQINGTKINTSADAIQIINQNKGTPISISILRNGVPINVTLIPRKDTPSGQGPTGVALSDYGYIFKKEPILILIPKTILFSYQDKLYQDQGQRLLKTGYALLRAEPGQSVDFSGPSSQSKIFTLFLGLFNMVVGIGLLKFKTWALYATFIFNLFAILGLIFTILGNLKIHPFSPLIDVFELAILTMAFVYLTKKRALFT